MSPADYLRGVGRAAPSIRLTKRDHDVLETLTLKVRLLALSQIATTWWGTLSLPERASAKRLAELQKADLVVGERLAIHPLLLLERPLAIWQPDLPAPNFSKLEYACQSRWKEAPEPTWLYYASKKAAKRYGGRGGKLKKRFQRTHDVHLSEVYLHLLRERPEDAAQWISEDDPRVSRGKGEKTPDAFLIASDGRPVRVVDFAGAYSAKRLLAFHEDCASRRLPYELW